MQTKNEEQITNLMHGLAIQCMKDMTPEDRHMCCRAGVKCMAEHGCITEDFSREVIDFYNSKYLKGDSNANKK